MVGATSFLAFVFVLIAFSTVSAELCSCFTLFVSCCVGVVIGLQDQLDGACH
jgi:hypothetical protein